MLEFPMFQSQSRFQVPRRYILLFAVVVMLVSTAYMFAPESRNTRPLEPRYLINEDDGTVKLRVCFNSSCARTRMVTFTADDMAKVKGQLSFCTGNDLFERIQRVRIAVWQMEKLAQKYEPLLLNDREVNDREFGIEGRMDCVDNSTNTTTYLKILEDMGQLPLWRVEKPSIRKFYDFNSVHWAAVVKDIPTGEDWAVDAWFRPNGHLPYVLPLDSWKKEIRGWLPPYDKLNPNPRASNEFCNN